MREQVLAALRQHDWNAEAARVWLKKNSELDLKIEYVRAICAEVAEVEWRNVVRAMGASRFPEAAAEARSRLGMLDLYLTDEVRSAVVRDEKSSEGTLQPAMGRL